MATVENVGAIPILTVTGKLFDEVQSVRALNIGLDGTSIHFSDVLDELRRYISYLKFYPNCGKQWQDEVLIKMLVGDAVGPQARAPRAFFEEPEVEEREVWPEGFESEVLGVMPGQDARDYLSRSDEVRHRIDQYWRTAATFLRGIPGAVACLTEKRRYAGIVPGGTKPGDKIFLVKGAKVPFVLQKRTGTCLLYTSDAADD